MRRAVDISSFLPALRCNTIGLLARHYRQHPLHIPTAQTDASRSYQRLRKETRDGGAGVGLQGSGEIDILLALDANALEGELGRADRRGRVQPHLGADAVIGGRIELRAKRA